MAQIMLPSEVKNQIAKDFEVAIQTVNKALRGEGKTPLMNQLRKVAIERGGEVYRGVRTTAKNVL